MKTKTIKKFTALVLVAAVLTLSLTACGSTGNDSSQNTSSDSASAESETLDSTDAGNETSESADAESETSQETASGDSVTVKLGVVGSIYEDLWASAQEALKSENINLEIVQFSDYVTPNNALDNGEIDLNAFQHRIYLQSEIDSYGYEIQNIGNTFIIPLNLYSEKISSVDELQDGDTIAIPDDLTNGGRALKVLEAAGIITLNPDAGFNPTVDDIETYNVDVTIEELKANVIPSTLPDVTAGIVNGNYALDYGLKTEEAVYKDTVLDEEEYWNLIAARTADLEDEEKAAVYEKVVKAFQSPETESVFNDTYGGYFIKVGWDEDLLAE